MGQLRQPSNRRWPTCLWLVNQLEADCLVCDWSICASRSLGEWAECLWWVNSASHQLGGAAGSGLRNGGQSAGNDNGRQNLTKGTHYATLGVDRKRLSFSVVFFTILLVYFCQYRGMFLTIKKVHTTAHTTVHNPWSWPQMAVFMYGFLYDFVSFYVSSGGCF